MFFELEQIADEAGLLADSHEVSDLLRERLGEEIEGRRRAIQRYGAPAGVEVLPASMRDLRALPRLADDVSPGGSALLREPAPVGLSTLPASRLLLRTTPAGTTAESPPQKPRRLAGVFALLVLFALGSLTTLALLHFRFLDEFAPGAVRSTAANASRIEPSELVAALVPAPSAPPSAATVPSAAAVPSPAAAVASQPESPSAVPAPTVSVAPSSAAPAKAAPTPPVAAAPPARPRVRPVRAVEKTAPAAPVLPVEENPYRLQ
jgi:hypothetical protein